MTTKILSNFFPEPDEVWSLVEEERISFGSLIGDLREPLPFELAYETISPETQAEIMKTVPEMTRAIFSFAFYSKAEPK